MPTKPRRKSRTRPAARRRSARNGDTIRVTASSVDGETTRTFKTLEGAREFARKRVGAHPDIGSSYAVSGDGVSWVSVSGVSLSELFGTHGGLRGPATEWTGPVVGRRSHWSFRDEGGGRRTSHVYIEVLPTDSFGDGFLPLADGTWVTIGGGSYTDGDGTDYVEINGHYAHGPTWEEIAGGSRAAAERYVARYERKRPRR